MQRQEIEVAGVVAGVGIALVVGLCPGVAAQEGAQAMTDPTTQGTTQAEKPAETEPTEYAYGTVTSISEGSLVVSQYDYTTGEMKDAAYTVDPAVELNNVSALTEIAQGDGVDIEYVVRDGKNIATAIIVDRMLLDEDAGDNETAPTPPAVNTKAAPQ